MSVKKSESGSSLVQTRHKLLQAAGEIFAETGFHDATVRDICMRAGTDSAAIGYHFGDKKTLYLEVLRFATDMAREKYPLNGGLDAQATPEMRLKAFVHSYLLRLLDAGPISWSGKLVAREMIKPTLALDAIIAESVRPVAKEIGQIVKALLGPKASPEQLFHCRLSIVSQCLFYNHCRTVLTRINPKQKFTPRDIEKLADHITRFSLGGLRQMANN